MATEEQIKADFDVAFRELDSMVVNLIPNQYVPFVGNIRDVARQKLYSKEGQDSLKRVVRKVIAADENYRAAHPAPEKQ